MSKILDSLIYSRIVGHYKSIKKGKKGEALK